MFEGLLLAEAGLSGNWYFQPNAEGLSMDSNS
jgi:hypothetical protein